MNLIKNQITAGFNPGQILLTAAANETIERADYLAALERHVSGDWGALSEADWKANDDALEKGARLVSAYHDRNGVTFWIITEADRSATTILLPSDY
jgi:hypothetical protein